MKKKEKLSGIAFALSSHSYVYVHTLALTNCMPCMHLCLGIMFVWAMFIQKEGDGGEE